MQNIKAGFVARIDAMSDENNIYATLKPLAEGIAADIEAFFEASDSKYEQLHEFVREATDRLRNIEEKSAKTGAAVSQSGSSKSGVVSGMVGGTISVQSIQTTRAQAQNTQAQGVRSQRVQTQGAQGNDAVMYMSGQLTNKTLLQGFRKLVLEMSNRPGDFNGFKNLTKYLYDRLFKEAWSKRKAIGYDLIIQLTSIYRRFYQDYGEILKDSFKSYDERKKYVEQGYLQVIRDRDNVKFFNGEEVWTFRSQAHHTYTVYDRVADMVKNIANACTKGEADGTNLVYGAYVLFDPIINGHIGGSGKNGEDDDSGENSQNSESLEKYAEFSDWAVKEFTRILGLADSSPDISESDAVMYMTNQPGNSLYNRLRVIELKMSNISNYKNKSQKVAVFNDFQKFTKYLYDTICDEVKKKDKILSYDIICQISDFYRRFYTDCGNILKSPFSEYDDRVAYVKREYFGVTRESGNDVFFNGNEEDELKSHAYHTYMVFRRVADMVKNVANACKKGEADDLNLRYGAYVLFDPIIKGSIEEDDIGVYVRFCRQALPSIQKIRESIQ